MNLNGYRVWLGGKYSGTWHLEDGSEFDSSLWGPGLPDAWPLNGQCMALNHENHIDDKSCLFAFYYVCEIPL